MSTEINIGGQRFTVRNRKTADRRIRGFDRGELNADGSTIPAKDRTPPGKPMRKKAKK